MNESMLNVLKRHNLRLEEFELKFEHKLHRTAIFFYSKVT